MSDTTDTNDADVNNANVNNADVNNADVNNADASNSAAAVAVTNAGIGAAREPASRQRIVVVGAVIIALAFMMVAWNTKDSAIRNTNVGSRYATVEALVNHGTFVIDDTQYRNTIDKVQIDGKFYSSKPPFLLVMAAGVYAVEKAVTGYDIVKQEKKVVWFVNLMFGAVLHALMLMSLLRLLLVMVRREEAILVTLAAAGFSFLGAGYAIELNNHSVGAALAMLTFTEAALIPLSNDERPIRYILAGTFAGILPGVDLPAGAISAAVGLYLFMHHRRRTLTYFAPAFVPWIVLQLVLNVMATGSVLPAYLQKGAYNYNNSYWNAPKGIDALDEPKWLYGIHITVGHHGVLAMSPLFFASIYALIMTVKEKSALYKEALVVAGTGIILFGYYWLFTKNYGGNCVGLRWMVPYHPFLFVFLAVYLDRVRLKWWGWALIVAGICVAEFHVFDAFWTPWHTARWHSWFAKVILR